MSVGCVDREAARNRLAPPRFEPLPDATSLVASLRDALEGAAALEVGKHDGWERLRVGARDVIAALIRAGHVPPHLAIRPDEPPAVIARTLASAWQRIADPSR